jgi:ribose transport system substrate-binding protein
VNPFEPQDIEAMIKALDTSLGALTVDPTTIRLAAIGNGQSTYWTPVQIGVAQSASIRGCFATFAAPPNSDSSQQQTIFSNQLTAGVKGVATSPIVPADMEPLFDQAISNGDSIITFDSDTPPGSMRELYIGSENVDAGKQAGQQMVKILGSAGGKVAIAIGSSTAQNAVDRVAGIKTAFMGTGVTLIDVLVDNRDFTMARQLIDMEIANHADLAGVITGWDYNGGIVCASVQAANKVGKIKIVSFDTNSDTMACLKGGTTSAVIGQRPYYQGYLAVQVLFSLVAQGQTATLSLLKPWLSGTDGRIINTGTDVVTADTLSTYKAYLASLGIDNQ